MILYSGWFDDFRPFDSFYPKALKLKATDPKHLQHKDALLLLWGGGDIHPSIYNRERLGSHVGPKLSLRDQMEVALFTRAVELGCGIVGICRGAQLGCALSGGILIQDVDGHHTDHKVQTSDGKELVTTSIHHQMMYPWDVEHELLAWANPPQVQKSSGLTRAEILKWPSKDGALIEPEVVWFPKTRCLAIQGHPEYMKTWEPFNVYVNRLVDDYLVPRT